MHTRIAALSVVVLMAASAVVIWSSDVPPALVRDPFAAAPIVRATKSRSLAADGLCTVQPRGIQALESGASCDLLAPETGS